MTLDAKHKYFFVDLAANDAVKLSNTLHLEQMGWDGVCIEGNPEYWYNLARHRKCTIIGAFVGGETDGNAVEVALKGIYGGIVGVGKTKNDTEIVVKRELVSIATILKESNAPSVIDYFSLDVEGAEALVLKNFPWNDYIMRFITIERPTRNVVTLLQENGYKQVSTLSKWRETLWVHEESVNLSQEEMDRIISESMSL